MTILGLFASRSRSRKIAAGTVACLVLVLAAIAMKRLTSDSTASAPRRLASAPAVSPPLPAGPDDLFEDVTAKAGIHFVHQFCDSKIANILESNGAGGCWLDFD